MCLVILLCLHASHSAVEALCFNGGMSRNIQFFGSVFLRPFSCRKEEPLPDSLAPHICRNMEAGEVKIVSGSPGQSRLYGSETFQFTIAEESIYESSRGGRVFQACDQNPIIRF